MSDVKLAWLFVVCSFNLVLALTAHAEDVPVRLDVTYSGCTIVEGPLSSGLSELPGSIDANFVFLSPSFPPPTDDEPFDPTLLSASFVLGDAVLQSDDFTEFGIAFGVDVDTLEPIVSQLAWQSNLFVTPTTEVAGPIYNHSFELNVFGTDSITGLDFHYRCPNSSQIFAEAEGASSAYLVEGDTNGTPWRFRVEALDDSCHVIEVAEGSSPGIPANGDPVAGALAFTAEVQRLINEADTGIVAPITETNVLEVMAAGAAEVQLFGGELDGKLFLADAAGITINPRVAQIAGTSTCPVAAVDLKPGSNPNCIKPNANGNVAVLLRGTSELDVMQVDRSLLDFGGAPPKKCAVGDAHPADGIPDLTCHFEISAVSWPTPGSNCDEVALTGELNDGTAVKGADLACLSGEPSCEAGTPR